MIVLFHASPVALHVVRVSLDLSFAFTTQHSVSCHVRSATKVEPTHYLLDIDGNVNMNFHEKCKLSLIIQKEKST